MATRKTSPPEEEKKPETKTRPVTRKAPAAKKPKKAPAKKTPAKKAAPKAEEPKKPEEVKPDAAEKAPEQPKKPRPKSPVNGVELPEGRKFTAGEVARENGSKGGIRSREARRQRKTLRDELLDLLSEVTTGEDGKEHTANEAISVALIRKAMFGDVRAYETIRDTIGEKQREQVDVNVTTPKFDALDAAFTAATGDAN